MYSDVISSDSLFLFSLFFSFFFSVSVEKKKKKIQVMLRSVARGVRALKVHPRVRDALALGKPVVALESTIISHGSLSAILH